MYANKGGTNDEKVKAAKIVDETFVVYCGGVALQLQWTSSPHIMPVQRLCAVAKDQLLMLMADECLYAARLVRNDTLQLELQRNDVKDMAYCQDTQQLFLITTAGLVLMQQLIAVGDDNFSSVIRANAWQPLSFDPLELSEHGIRVQRVCCSAQGVLFVTHTGDIYGMGSCGAIFSGEAQPKLLSKHLFDECNKQRKEVLEMVAGDEFFVLLLRCVYAEKDEAVLDLLSKRTTNKAGSSATFPGGTPQMLRIAHQSRSEEINAELPSLVTKVELNSNSSLLSLSASSSKSSHGEPDFETNIQMLLKQGYALLHTQVYTFGGANGGLLGTGDHIKRNGSNNIQKLDTIGVCSIATGREHSVARTLDGRLYHWGCNSKQQLHGSPDLNDLSAPTEFKLDSIELDEKQRNILAACCGDFQTVLLNARGELHEKDKQLLTYNKDFLTLQMPVPSAICKEATPLLLMAGNFTLHNLRRFQHSYHICFSNLQSVLHQMLRYRRFVDKLQSIQPKVTVLKQLEPALLGYQRMLCLLAATLWSLECFYRGDFENATDLLFIKYHRECIELLEQYTKNFCDIFSIDGFAEAANYFAHFSSEQQQDSLDWVRIFQQPFQLFPNYVQFLERLIKTRPEFKEHLQAWLSFAQQHRIDLELSDNTHNFWLAQERNVKIRHFRRKHRRVILTSASVPLKLANNAVSMYSTNFILFSDCLCQSSGSTLHTYPLVTMWLGKIDSDTHLRIVTPERTFNLIARSYHDKKLWLDQLEHSILAALGCPPNSKLSQVRTTAYVFSPSHAKYANVHAYGRWRNGVLHGNCYLEYPDGRFYFGEMRHGEIEGYGKMVIPSVGLYEGTFKAGKFHGHGNYEMKDNEVYEGNFRDGMFHGHGLLRTNNYTYVGEYQSNAKCGYGIQDDMLTGDKYMGMFADNKHVGAGTCITMNGDYFEGIFDNDELAGTGIAVFENDYYYEGDLTMHGPNGRGTYYMPTGAVETSVSMNSYISDDEEYAQRQLSGNVLSGQLGGNWHDVRVLSGTVAINRQFPKNPSSIGSHVVDNNRKWRALFDNFEEQILGASYNNAKKSEPNTNNATKQLWNRIAVFMNTQRAREKAQEQQQQQEHTHSYFGKNISLGFTTSAKNSDKISLKSTNSLLTTAKSSILDLTGNLTAAIDGSRRRSHSQETLNDADLSDLDLMNSCIGFPYYHSEEQAFLLNSQLGSWANDSTASTRSSFDSVLNVSGGSLNNNNSFSSQTGLDFVPSFGINSLNEQDLVAIKEYLTQAFKDRHHPLYVLNQRIANCFYTSYGCWKVKPTPILTKQAMREWQNLSKRVYKFVRKMFPALPEDYCVLESVEGVSEGISHVTLLYPIVLSEGIYSTLFVLYANKYSRKDEMYRQNLMCAEKLEDEALAELLGLESSFLPVVRHSLFKNAIQTLVQLQEKYSPKDMLTVIEKCIQQIIDAHKMVESKTTEILAGDSMLPLALVLVLRAAVPHLGAELALLDDLTGGDNFQFDGIGLYCLTTLKASYEYITAKPLNKT